MLRSMIAGVRALLRPAERNAEIEEELRSFYDASVEGKMRSGMSAKSAQRAARIEIGSGEMVRHKVWSAGWESRADSLLRDLRLTFRQLRKSLGFTLTAVLTLAFGIGATTCIFSIVNGVLLQPLPFPDASRLVTLGEQVSGFNWEEGMPGIATPPEVVTYQRDTRSFQSLGGYTYASYELSGVGQPAQVRGGRMTPSIFSTLGVAPLLGRVFTPEEDRQKAQVAVLSYATWKSRFNGNPHVLGTTIDLDREPYTVIGVMPRNFAFPLWVGRDRICELWVPTSFSAQELSPEGGGQSWNLMMVGRLKPSVTVAQAQADAQRVAAQIMRSFPPDLSNIRIRPVVNPLHAITVDYYRPLLRILFLAVAVVLLIACANLAGLLLVRAIRRQRETAVRRALGAPARTLLVQTMLESLVISMTGGILGIGLASLSFTIGRNFLPGKLPLTNEIALNWTVAGFALLLALLTGALCGLAPGFAALRINVNASLKEGGRSGSASGAHARLRSALVVAEIAIALVLLCASGLFLRSYMKVSDVDLGFQPSHLTTAAYTLPQKEYSTQTRVDAFNSQVLLRLSQLPGVQSVGLTDVLPITGGGIGSFVVDGYVDPRGPGNTVAISSDVIGDFFKTMDISLMRGRYFTDSDNANGQLVVIVSHRFAEHYWPNQNPIGKRLRLGTPKASGIPWLTVVGEVAEAKLVRPDLDAPEQYSEQFYLPVAQDEKDIGTSATATDLNGNGGYIVVRSALPPEQMKNDLTTVVLAIDPQLPLSQVQTMEQVVSQSEASRRFNTTMISAFALAAILLAVLGIYSIIAFSVASRAQEMAIRIALGAKRGDILRLVLISGAKLAAVGAVIGMAGAGATAGLVRSFLFQVSPYDPVVLVLAPIAVFALALLASTMPARRAAAVDPMEALRGE
jgi:predicted permease